MDSRVSKYNAKKLVSICEICRESMASEVHHLIHQKSANSKGLVYEGQYHKNHTGNLVSICEKCHKEMHNAENHETDMFRKKVSTVTTNSKNGTKMRASSVITKKKKERKEVES